MEITKKQAEKLKSCKMKEERGQKKQTDWWTNGHLWL